MQNNQQILSCDWGTTSFRLRLVNTDSGKVMGEVVSDKGNAVLFKQWKENTSINRVEFYLGYLKESIREISTKVSWALDNMPVIISGMASSSIGMKELPYANLPFSLDGHSAYTEWINGQPILDNSILLISGVQQHDDVMRGEEIQLVGISSLLDLPEESETLYILPGTHSKHISVTDNEITHFNTFMTGEIFDIISRHSILAHAVSAPGNYTKNSKQREAFKKGVSKSFQTTLLNSLFSVRTNQLKNYLTDGENYFYLSGLLIGSEISYLQKTTRRIILCSSGHLQDLYRIAIECAGVTDNTIVVEAQILENAAAAGQLKVFKQLVAKTI